MDAKILNEALGPGPDCLDVEALGRYADDAMPPVERARAAAHIDACAVCQAELTLLHRFAAAELSPEEVAPVAEIVADLRQRPSPIPASTGEPARATKGFWAWAGMSRAILSAAAVVTLVVGGYVFTRNTPSTLPTIDPGSDVVRSETVTLTSPVGDQPAAPDRFAWAKVDGAARYRVRLMEVDRHELWSSDATGTSIEVPHDVRTAIVPAKTLMWTVTAYSGSGAEIAASAPQRFRLVP